MHLPLVEKLAERFDEVLARVNMNRFELQRSEERIPLRRLAPRKLFVRPPIRPAERVENDHLSCLGVAQANQAHIWHFEFPLIADHKRNNIVLATRDLERPLVTRVLKIADQKYYGPP